MKTVLNLGSAILMALTGTTNANDLAAYQWKNRPVLVFADSADDENFREQMKLLNDANADITERDIVVIEDTTPSQKSNLRERFQPNGFLFVLVGKDGGAKLKSTSPVNIESLNSLIDAMPMRLQEIRKQED